MVTLTVSSVYIHIYIYINSHASINLQIYLCNQTQLDLMAQTQSTESVEEYNRKAARTLIMQTRYGVKGQSG